MCTVQDSVLFQQWTSFDLNDCDDEMCVFPSFFRALSQIYLGSRISVSLHGATGIGPPVTLRVETEFEGWTFRLTQVLSEHGCFGKYLYSVAKRKFPPVTAHCCHSRRSPLLYAPLPAVTTVLSQSLPFAKTSEAAEKAQENDLHSYPIRCRWTGWRKHTYFS